MGPFWGRTTVRSPISSKDSMCVKDYEHTAILNQMKPFGQYAKVR